MGGKSAPAPDYSGMEAIAREQLAFSKRQYADMKPIAMEIAGLQADAQRQQMDQAADYYAYQQDTFRPLEEGLVADAQNMDTEAYRSQMAAEASAAAGRAFSSSQAMQNRSLAARGVNPNSGAARAGNNSMGLQQAAMRAQGMTSARQGAEDRARNAKYAAAGLGRNLATNASAAYGGATAAGGAAMGTYQAPGAAYMGGLSSSAGIYGQIAGQQNQAYMQAQGNKAALTGALLGAGSSLGAAAISDRRLKRDITRVGVDEKTGLPIYQYRYKDNPAVAYEGVMSDDVRELYPNAVIVMPDGFDAVNYQELGIELKVLGE